MKKYMKTLVFLLVLGCALTTWAFPLKVDIDVSTRRSRKQIGSGASGEVRVENVQLKIKIRKSGGDIPEGKLAVELYVIGKQVETGNYGIMDVKKGDIELLKENDYAFTYDSPAYTLGKTSGNINVGAQYQTYLVIVSGPDGEVIDWRSGRALRDEDVEKIRTFGPMTMFDKSVNVIGKLENPDAAFEAAVPIATSPRRRGD